MKWLIALAAGSVAACGGGAGDPPEPEPEPTWPPGVSSGVIPWQDQGCETTDGPPVALLTEGAAAMLTVPTEPLPGPIDHAVHSLVAQPLEGGMMFAATGTDVYRTLDGGCYWELHYQGDEPITLSASSFPWYVYGVNESGDTVITFGNAPYWESDLPFTLVDMAETRYGTGYALTEDGRILRQRFNLAEVLWDEVGPAPTGGTARYLAVDPSSTPYKVMHAVVAMTEGPTMVTFDDGATWTESEGLVAGADRIVTGEPVYGVNHFTNYELTPDDLWIYVERTRAGVAERVIAHSTDGGRTFTDILLDGPETPFKDPQLAAPPGSSGALVLTGDECAAGEPVVLRVAVGPDSVSVLSFELPGLIGIESIAFNENFQQYMYLGPRTVADCA